MPTYNKQIYVKQMKYNCFSVQVTIILQFISKSGLDNQFHENSQIVLSHCTSFQSWLSSLTVFSAVLLKFDTLNTVLMQYFGNVFTMIVHSIFKEPWELEQGDEVQLS
jgi:hypothetical protein